LNGDDKTARSNTQPRNSGIMLVSSNLRIGSKEYPETSYLAYNNMPRYNPKELHLFYFTLVRADYVMWSLSLRFQRKCRNELSETNSRATTASSNTPVLYISRQTGSICRY